MILFSFILGKIYHQGDTNPIELLVDAITESYVSDLISDVMNRSLVPKNIFVIEGVKKDIRIKGVKIE